MLRKLKEIENASRKNEISAISRGETHCKSGPRCPHAVALISMCFLLFQMAPCLNSKRGMSQFGLGGCCNSGPRTINRFRIRTESIQYYQHRAQEGSLHACLCLPVRPMRAREVKVCWQPNFPHFAGTLENRQCWRLCLQIVPGTKRIIEKQDSSNKYYYRMLCLQQLQDRKYIFKNNSHPSISRIAANSWRLSGPCNTT